MYFLRVLLITLSFAFFFSFLIVGNKGINAYLKIKESVLSEELEILALENKHKMLDHQIKSWEQDKFLVEKAAREELLLGMPGEKVYIIKT